MRDHYSIEQRGDFFYIFLDNLFIFKTNVKDKIEDLITKDIEERNDV